MYFTYQEQNHIKKERKERNTILQKLKLVEMVWKIMSQICQKVKSFTILEKWNFLKI